MANGLRMGELARCSARRRFSSLALVLALAAAACSSSAGSGASPAVDADDQSDADLTADTGAAADTGACDASCDAGDTARTDSAPFDQPLDGGPDQAETPDAADTATPTAATCIRGVPERFLEIPTSVTREQYLGANNPDVIPWPRYTSNIENGFGLGEHFQGIQRTGRFVILTGGQKNGTTMSQLILIEMGSRSETGAWSLPTYGHDFERPPVEDRLLAVVDLDPDLWHAGGPQISEGILVVPLEADGLDAQVRFFDVSDPASPVALPARIVRPGKAHAAALTREADGTFLVLVWDDAVLDFYRSKSGNLADGFKAAHVVADPADVVGSFQEGACGITGCGTYQAVNFVRDCDGRLFLFGARNTQKGAPALEGEDFADLFEVTWPDGPDAAPLLTAVAHRAFTCADSQCNFGAGAGLHVLDEDHLVLYGASHWLHDGNSRFNFNEYAAP